MPAIERALASGEAGSRLLAVLVSEIGVLNEVLIVQALERAAGPLGIGAMRASAAGNGFGVGDTVVEANAATFASFPFVPPMTAGRFGPVFELRESRSDRRAWSRRSLPGKWRCQRGLRSLRADRRVRAGRRAAAHAPLVGPMRA